MAKETVEEKEWEVPQGWAFTYVQPGEELYVHDGYEGLTRSVEDDQRQVVDRTGFEEGGATEALQTLKEKAPEIVTLFRKLLREELMPRLITVGWHFEKRKTYNHQKDALSFSGEQMTAFNKAFYSKLKPLITRDIFNAIIPNGPIRTWFKSLWEDMRKTDNADWAVLSQTKGNIGMDTKAFCTFNGKGNALENINDAILFLDYLEKKLGALQPQLITKATSTAIEEITTGGTTDAISVGRADGKASEKASAETPEVPPFDAEQTIATLIEETPDVTRLPWAFINTLQTLPNWDDKIALFQAAAHHPRFKTATRSIQQGENGTFVRRFDFPHVPGEGVFFWDQVFGNIVVPPGERIKLERAIIASIGARMAWNASGSISPIQSPHFSERITQTP